MNELNTHFSLFIFLKIKLHEEIYSMICFSEKCFLFNSISFTINHFIFYDEINHNNNSTTIQT